jgi:excisionase family DNA binding protein
MQLHHIIISPEELVELIKHTISVEFKKQITPIVANKSQPLNPICFIEEASKITGLAISTIRSKCNLRKIPFFKPKGTKKLQFKRTELLEWMESGKIKSITEQEADIDNYLISKKKKSNRKKY